MFLTGVIYRLIYYVNFFFFQAEDGIRDLTVTGVQTCALPIFLLRQGIRGNDGFSFANLLSGMGVPPVPRGFGFENWVFSVGGFGFAAALLTRDRKSVV